MNDHKFCKKCMKPGKRCECGKHSIENGGKAPGYELNKLAFALSPGMKSNLMAAGKGALVTGAIGAGVGALTGGAEGALKGGLMGAAGGGLAAGGHNAAMNSAHPLAQQYQNAVQGGQGLAPLPSLPTAPPQAPQQMDMFPKAAAERGQRHAMVRYGLVA